jgi:dolichol-phosphate mannosyltransferase
MKFLIAVPVFNEEKYVGPVLREIRKFSRVAGQSQQVDTRVLVVDDGSTDATPAVLAELAAKGQIELITHPENRGYGQSLIDAFGFASDNGYDWVITLDCDEQHEPSRIPCFVEACLKDDVDIVSGSRYLDESLETDAPPADRRSINKLITNLLNAVLHLQVEGSNGAGLTDSFCGFKAHRVSAMDRLRLTIPGYAFPMQFWVQADAQGLRVRELPVRLIYKDATRHFGGLLDDPSARLQHYIAVLTNEIRLVRQEAHVTPNGAECASGCDL